MTLYAGRVSIPAAQRGMATLITALVLLFLVTFVTLSATRTVVTEQRVTANDVRARIALEAAEAGAERAYAYLNDLNCDPTAEPVGDVWHCGPEPVDGVPDNDWTTGWITLGNGSAYQVTFSPMTITAPGKPTVTGTQVRSVGRSDDGTATRTIVVTVPRMEMFAAMPEHAVVSRSNIDGNGNMKIYNPDGFSTVWSGGTASNAAQGGFATSANGGTYTYDEEGNEVQLSTANSLGPDVIEQDNNLAGMEGDEFFENFFNATKEQMREQAATNPAIHWIEPGDPFPATSQSDPKIIIIDGNYQFNGGNLFGLLYVTGDLSLKGNVNITGSLVVEGATSHNGNPTVTYSRDILTSLNKKGYAVGMSGSWRDWL